MTARRPSTEDRPRTVSRHSSNDDHCSPGFGWLCWGVFCCLSVLFPSCSFGFPSLLVDADWIEGLKH